MLLKWANQCGNTWNAYPGRGFVNVFYKSELGVRIEFRVFQDGGVLFHSNFYLSGQELRDMNAAIGEARAYLNQPVLERGD